MDLSRLGDDASSFASAAAKGVPADLAAAPPVAAVTDVRLASAATFPGLDPGGFSPAAQAAFAAGLAAALGVPAASVTAEPPKAAPAVAAAASRRRRRDALQAASAGGGAVLLQFTVSIGTASGLAARAAAASAGVTSAVSSLSSPLYSALQQAGLAVSSPASAAAPTVAVEMTLTVPVHARLAPAEAAARLAAAAGAGGPIEGSLSEVIGPSARVVVGQPTVILPPPLPPSSPPPPPALPPSPMPPLPPLAPLAPTGCDLLPCWVPTQADIPSVKWCADTTDTVHFHAFSLPPSLCCHPYLAAFPLLRWRSARNIIPPAPAYFISFSEPQNSAPTRRRWKQREGSSSSVDPGA